MQEKNPTKYEKKYVRERERERERERGQECIDLFGKLIN